ncbi:multi-sensor signal transduction histidine kinase [Rhodopseudomonas palustris HaA2]|uniref:histidine kinase n=1 Tax=Rhodopseudomonas palustris (strain HaA2) TaxID=316058 RepID=Q2J3N6_RHOP2|nr:ATP-binding protein [Rhodopseudomonas palustris]ABD04924.1 multi-sensor signal transduction histidine kinase [Rhodopseudomonas palustris HaA2]
MTTIDQRRRQVVILAAFISLLLIFAADALSPIDGAVAVLYTGVVLMVAPLGRRFILAAGYISAVLTATAFLWGHANDLVSGALLRFAVSLVAILITVLLSLRDRSARVTLAEQGRILELSHDTVVIRDPSGVVRYWNEGAARLYGWTRGEAIGRQCDDLLQGIVPVEEINQSLRRTGAWSGEIVRTRRDGTPLVLATRWLQRRDPEGRPIGVIETSADLTERRRAQAEQRRSEHRFSTIFNSGGFAALECDLSGAMRLVLAAGTGEELAPAVRAYPQLLDKAADEIRIYNANTAALVMFEAETTADLSSGKVLRGSKQDTGWALETIFTQLAAGAMLVETEARFATLSGQPIDAVLRLSVLPDGVDWSRVLLMAFDVTERNRARAKIEQTSVELAHAGRVSVLGQLAASIAHEVNQPLAAIINYGKSGKRWLTRAEPDLVEVADCLDKIVSNGNRAADVVGRVRSLARKSAPQAGPVDLAALVQDAAALLARETRSAGTAIRIDQNGRLPQVECDRVQVQQVVVNLMMNALQATRGAGSSSEIRVSLDGTADDAIVVAVRDSGTGIAGDPHRIFDPFFSTKPDGMGLGLSICKTIIEAQGGSISASNNVGPGATVAFTLPRKASAEAAGARRLIS